MKLLISMLVIATSFGLKAQSPQSDTRVAITCCEEGRGCTGSSYCTACKNCSGCKHCAKNGGTCGVCSSVRSKPPRSITVIHKPAALKFSKGMLVDVSPSVLNLREAPSASSKILEKLKADQEVEVIEVLGSWLKVKAIESQKIGYVYSDYLK